MKLPEVTLPVGFRNDEVKRLRNFLYLVNLIELHLRWNEIGAEGARALAQSPHLKCIATLFLWDNEISDEGRNALENSPWLVGGKIVF